MYLDDFVDFVVTALGVILFSAAILTPCFFAIDGMVRYQCGNYEKTTGKQTKYIFADACYIKTDDGWQRWDEYKARAIASEGLGDG